MTQTPLLSKAAFSGLDDLTHLCSGGESPWLGSHDEVYARFTALKSGGSKGRDQVLDIVEQARAKIGVLWNVPADRVAFMPASYEGMNYLARGIDWQPGDNLVTTALEFPSVAWAWRDLAERGVEVRFVQPENWIMDEAALLAATDSRTRLLVVSQVSYYTGQNLDMQRLADGIDRDTTLLAVDATHASGVLPVDASVSDLTISSSYKWMLATTGCAPVYVSDRTLEQVAVTSYGWHNLQYVQPPNPAQTNLLSMPALLEPGNFALLNIMLLNNALDTTLGIGIDSIAAHARALSALATDTLTDLGLDVVTPREELRRSGNTCFVHPDSDTLCARLDERGVLVWGDRGRIRVSTHLYNDAPDIANLGKQLAPLLAS